MIKNAIMVFQVGLVYIVLSIYCFLMLRTVVGYTVFRDNIGFLQYKQPYIHDPIWKIAFYIHVFTATLTLFAGFTQFSTRLLRDYPNMHRFLGKLYIGNILFINAPIGFIMALDANGGFLGKTAFVILDMLWFLFTLRGYQYAKSRQFVAHKNYMIRSYALTCSALALRTWRIILVSFTSIDPDEIYIIDSYLGLIPNLIIAELIIRIKSLQPIQVRQLQPEQTLIARL